MRIDPRTLLRGLGKLVAVVLVAGLAGAGIGIGLAKLSGNEASSEPVLPATTRPPSTSTAGAPATTGTQTTTATQTTSSTATVYRVPRVQVLAAKLVTTTSGGSRVTAKIRVTNRGNRPLTIKTPVLISGPNEVTLDTARDAARTLLAPIAVGASATGTLRFSTSAALTQRLRATPRARLRLGNRTVTLSLTTSGAAGAPTG